MELSKGQISALRAKARTLNEEKYLEASRKRLSAIIEKKIRTSFIGAIAAFEEVLGELWGVGLDEEDLSEEVVEDDDLLDGWLILENRKREEERKGGDDDKNKSGTTEVFVPVDTIEDARRVNALNDANAKLIKRERASRLAQKGVVKEQELPDARQRMAQQMAQQLKQHVKRG